MTIQHELINLDGYGNSTNELVKRNLWDETKIIDGVTEYEFTVKVTGHYHPVGDTQTVKVIATDEDDALDQAENMVDFDEIEDTEIIKLDVTG